MRYPQIKGLNPFLTTKNMNLKDIHDKIKEKEKYKRAFYILMEYWASLPDEEKPDINRRLDELDV